MKKTFKSIGIILLVLFLFRGALFRFFINYTEIGTRTEIPITHPRFIAKIENMSADQTINFHTVIQIAANITTENLYFVGETASKNPNKLFDIHQANCVGYAAFFNATAQYLIKKHQLSDQIESKHLVGRLDFLGMDLHQFFKNPFFKDHDFNEIKNLETGESVFIDASVRDYLGIKSVQSIK